MAEGQAIRPTSALGGKIDSMRSVKNGWRTVVRIPAQDEFSSPASVEVGSEKRLGKPGDMIDVEVELGGYRRTYYDKEGNQVVTADNTLTVVGG